MRRLLHLLALSLGLFWISPASATRSAAEEFIAPLQSTSIPRSTERVRTIRDELTGGPALQARTAQAAIGAAVGQRAAGCRMIRFGNKPGWVATGTARYPASDNPVATLRLEQEARFKAFVDARFHLSECFTGLSGDARRQVAETLEQDDAIRLALINLASNDRERLEQALRILQRGFVAYLVEADSATRTVFAHLVTTPRTATRLTRPTPSAMETTSLQEGLKQALAEIEGRLIPPVGHRQVVVNITGETALIGYATNLVGAHPNPDAQQKLRADAEKIALSRATAALTGLVTGADEAWRNDLDEASQAEILAIARSYDEGEPSARRFTQIRDLLMMGMLEQDSGLQALREGRLPSAITIKRFEGEHHVSVALIYTPSVRKRQPAPSAASATRPEPPPVATPVATPVEPSPTDPATTEAR